MKISVSLLSAYLYCSRKLFLEEVLMLREPPKESVVIGAIRHEAYEMINSAEQDLISSISEVISFEELCSKYKNAYLKMLRKVIVNNKQRIEQVDLGMIEAYRRSLPYIVDEAQSRSKNIFDFMENNLIFGDELWARLTPKIISEMYLDSNELKLKGIIDQVHIYENEYIPIELKTGRAPYEGIWPGHRVQIAAYSMLLSEHLKKPIAKGFVHYLDSKEKRHIVINPFMKDEVKQLVNEVIQLLENDKIPDFCNNKNKCNKCSSRQTCYSEEAISNLLKVKV